MEASRAVRVSIFAEKHSFVALGFIRFLQPVAADILPFSMAVRVAFVSAQMPRFRSLLGGDGRKSAQTLRRSEIG